MAVQTREIEEARSQAGEPIAKTRGADARFRRSIIDRRATRDVACRIEDDLGPVDLPGQRLDGEDAFHPLALATAGQPDLEALVASAEADPPRPEDLGELEVLRPAPRAGTAGKKNRCAESANLPDVRAKVQLGYVYDRARRWPRRPERRPGPSFFYHDRAKPAKKRMPPPRSARPQSSMG